MDLATYAAELNKSARKYRKPLLMLPSIGIGEFLKYATGFPGVTYEQTVGEIFANSELRPYNGDNNEEDTSELFERTLKTYLGSLVELFDPNQLRQTIYAQLKANGDSVKDAEMNKALMFSIMNSVLEKLGDAVWSGVRDATGETTQDLFNGYDTITSTEITEGNISSEKKNLVELSEAITDSNAVDALKLIWRSAKKELRKKNTFMFVDPDILDAYDDDYLTTVGSAPYNNQFEQRFLIGSSKRCEIVPLVGKQGSGFIHISTKKNMVYGYGNGVEKEKIEVRRGNNAFKLQFILAMFFGVEFSTLNPKELMVAKLVTESESEE